MKVDILTKAQFKLFEDNMISVMNEIHDNMRKMSNLIMQLQDRIKMLEDRNGLETNK